MMLYQNIPYIDNFRLDILCIYHFAQSYNKVTYVRSYIAMMSYDQPFSYVKPV